MKTALLGLRFLLALATAALLLYCLSYPDSIIPARAFYPSEAAEWLAKAKPALFLLPLLLLELICAMGPQRNRVYFSALLTVLAAALLAWPLLQAHYPEYVHRSFDYEDGKLAQGVLFFSLLLLGSVLLRLVFLQYLFGQNRFEDELENSPNSMEADALDPAKGRSLQEILAHPQRVRPNFLFGGADQGLISRFLRLLRGREERDSRRRMLWLTLVAAGALFFFLYPQPTEQEAYARDLSRMFETRSGKASRGAVHAAARAMDYISKHALIDGKSRAEAEAILGLQKLPREQYRRVRDETYRPQDPTDDCCYRFLSISDGQRNATLYIRTNLAGDIINISEFRERGWNAVTDYLRDNFGSDVYRDILH